MHLLHTLVEGDEPVIRFIEWVSIIIEIVAVSWIFAGVFGSTVHYFYRIIKKTPPMLERYTDTGTR